MHKKGTAGKKVRGAGEGGFQQRAAVCSACTFCYTDTCHIRLQTPICTESLLVTSEATMLSFSCNNCQRPYLSELRSENHTHVLT